MGVSNPWTLTLKSASCPALRNGRETLRVFFDEGAKYECNLVLAKFLAQEAFVKILDLTKTNVINPFSFTFSLAGVQAME
ncbi:MAG: hypothetical protein AB1589_09385 [Cyanobacteriota bacterium]